MQNMNMIISFLTVCIPVLCINFFAILNMWRPSIYRLIELEKCPACYGVSECNEIQTILIENTNSLWNTYFLQTKNVFYGTLNGTKVVVKKLAHTEELKTFDRMFKDLSDSDKNIRFVDLIEKEINLPFAEDADSRLRLCPTTEHKDDLFYNVYEKQNKTVYSKYSDVHLWTLVKINPEPLILQILPAENGWPVPKYIGACGRVIVEEYIGNLLFFYEHEPWILRAKIALSLLDAVHMLTFGNENFAFYLTDISPLNIAVDSNFRAKFIDLENVIVVDKKISGKKPKDWSLLHESQANFGCVNCFEFCTADICSHRFSDHNYFAVCKLLLPAGDESYSLRQGLLHDVPLHISEKYPILKNLIHQCGEPIPPKNRIMVVHELAALIKTIL